MPFVDARLEVGTRVHAVLGTVASPGTCISLRVPAGRSFSLEDCVASGSLTPGAAQFIPLGLSIVECCASLRAAVSSIPSH